MDLAKAIDALKDYSKKDKAAHDLFTQFATRKRARAMITLPNIVRVMKEEGFKHSKAQYEAVLTKLEDVGIGKITRYANGQVYGLAGIKLSLPDLGQALIGSTKIVRNFAPRNRFSPIKASLDPVLPKHLERLDHLNKLLKAILEEEDLPSDVRVRAARSLISGAA